MGNCFCSIFRRRNVRRHIILILIGLDNAGKTETVNNLAGETDDKVLPTVGFKAVNLVHKDTPVTIYDLGGGPAFRAIWPQYYSEVHGVIFVIDSSDFARLDECKAVLEEVLSHDKIAGKPILVLANKQDKQGALDDIDVVEKLNIEPLVNKYRCPTLVESYSATPQTNTKKPVLDPGLKKGYQWLLNYIVRRYGDINLRVQTDIHAELERRKRLMLKASKTSQTYTAANDEISTQTGFANPNYETLTRKSTPENNREKELLESSVIVVKPITHSLNTTVTIESVDSVLSSKKPKLSPLFGRVSDNSTLTEEPKVELEPRSEFRKLSPIVRKKSGGDQHMDFKDRPQSSPRNQKNDISCKSSSPEGVFKGSNITEVCLGESLQNKKRPAFVNDAEMTREVFAERLDTTKGASSDIIPHGSSRTLPVAPRPASASQLVRRQLEIQAQHKRRLSLRYMHRNKTSPERLGVFHYEPGKTSLPQKHLDMGDFELNLSCGNQRDVGM